MNGNSTAHHDHEDVLKNSERWINTPDEEITLELIQEILGTIPDDVWVAAACVDRTVDDISVQRQLIQTGLERTEEAVNGAKRVAELAKQSDGEEAADEEGSQHSTTSTDVDFEDNTKQLLALRKTLLRTSDKLETYVSMAQAANWNLSEDEEEQEEPPVVIETSPDPYSELDPWAQTDDEPTSPVPEPQPTVHPTISLSSFLFIPLLHSALILASTLQCPPLKILLLRHASELIPYRFEILDALPTYAHPSLIADILPTFDFATSRETLPKSTPWRETLDWSESAEAAALIQDVDPQLLPNDVVPGHHVREEAPRSDAQLSQWYQDRVLKIDTQLGLVDVALAFIQHGASQGIPGLDELGEDLSLLSRLVYDTASSGTEDWSWCRWKTMDTDAVVRSYLSHSTPESLPADIRRLVLPYLYVLEARAERAGAPDPAIPSRHLYSYLLSASLELAAAIFEASKATLPLGQRLIQNDEDVARLALACLYGSDSLYEWGTMSQIFECMPEFPYNSSDDDETGDEAADTTLESLAAFVTPSTTRPKATPQELLIFFTPLSAKSLSRALDVLDVHLESGEILSRWEVPAPLRWFLQSANNEADQRARATRMARRNSNGAEMDDDDEWIDLMKDMVRMASSGEGVLRGAFGLLKKQEVVKIFFGGMLSLGRFALAKRLLNPPGGGRPLSNKVIEELCLHTSRELYDNASSGNLNFGDMKLAYECLNVSIATPAIIAEREFIEATSKICSYDVQTRPGIPMSPLEIRLVKDRLSLVARVLSSNENAYKHSEVILDIVKKLGFRGDVTAEIKTLAMLTDSATQAEDFTRAAEISERMVKTTFELQQRTARSPTSTATFDEADATSVDEAVEVCWHTCFQLGRQPEFSDVKKKLALLGDALQMCPSENALDVLSVWKRVEGESLEAAKARRARGARGNRNRTAAHSRRQSAAFSSARLPSLSSHLLSMPSAPLTTEAAAAMASRTLNKVAGVAANFPFSIRGRLRDDGSNSSRSRDGSASGIGRSPSTDVSHQARAALAKGMGWLIGADEDEL